MKFKTGQRVTVTESIVPEDDVWVGKLLTLVEGDPSGDWRVKENDMHWHESQLSLASENPYLFGQIIDRGDSECSRRVIGVQGDVVFLSEANNYDVIGVAYHYQELVSAGYKVVDKKYTETIEIAGKKYDKL